MIKYLLMALMAIAITGCSTTAYTEVGNEGEDYINNGTKGRLNVFDYTRLKVMAAQARTEEERNKVLQLLYLRQSTQIEKGNIAEVKSLQELINYLRSFPSTPIPVVNKPTARSASYNSNPTSNYKEAVNNKSFARVKLKNDTKYKATLASGLDLDPGQTSEELELETDGKTVKLDYQLFDPKTTKRWHPLGQRLALSENSNVLSIKGN